MKLKKKLGAPRKFENPQELWEHYVDYREWIDNNPMEDQQWVGKEAREVSKKHYEPPTWIGFESYLFTHGIAYDLDRYRYNTDNGYEDFIGIIRAIGNANWAVKFHGASANIFNQNIIARELGLGEKVETTEYQRPILEGGRELPKD